MKKNIKGFSFYALLLLVLLIAVFISSNRFDTMKGDYGYQDLVKEIDDVVRIEVKQNAEIPTGIVTIYYDNTDSRSFPITNTTKFEENMEQYGKKVYVKDIVRPGWFIQILPSLIILIPVIFLLIFIMNQAQGGGGGNRVMSFGKSKAKMVVDENKKITFQNVAGLEEEKEELEEVVEFLKSPRKFVELGARIPKGVLLVGPPGTGKTLLAKAVAGEAGVPFFSISGSDFVEMFVGVGASRVRDLFDQAKKNAPCIVFIDEIDAVGRKRGAGLGGGHDEREQTLNQLLVEMDGFGVNEGVIVIAATNRADILDPALLRPGRFDRKVVVGRPDVKGREEILKVHAKGKPLSDNVNLNVIAKTTVGFTGADLENLLNEASIYAARASKKVIEQEDVQKAFIKLGVGTEKKSKVLTEREKKITAYHEAGHAILFHVLPLVNPVHSISIIPTGYAGGYTMPLPETDDTYQSKKEMEQDIIVGLGGRAAEQIIFDDITTGAYGDLQQVTSTARNMVVKFGMSDVIGPIQFGNDNDEVFIGRDWGHTRNYGENIAGLIDSEIKRIVDNAYNEALRLLNENMDVMHKTVQLLFEKEKITGEEFAALFDKEYKKVDKSDVDSVVVAPLEKQVKLDVDSGEDK
ncbi:ATP-dependent zinc metalloprotease FtsH [Vallitalea guaymasensis]|uniref:ATP-dependent zinc metalloprotease FtsH n=1 Tax=Vallitalea guaymasensis TaxID=1185412 RepID=A0A8J8MB79_9FIRM|nr:ATP-dependent zinc metalloprotease FtsH [Vallitalea guaymasensis]QUH29593.1 ATP-dependent zinc metalloprotease FtsH [Vallitalea guaymasensis]